MRFRSNRSSQPGPGHPHQNHSRRAGYVSLAAVIVIPAAAAFVITGAEEKLPATPKVTRVLESVSEAPMRRAKRPPTDAPVAAPLGGKKVGITFDRGSRVPLGDLEIPAIDLKTKFYDGVVDASVELGPGHWPGTPWPGESGNSVFAGHRTTFTRPFADLDLLESGHRILAQVRNGPLTTYRVSNVTVVPEAEYADFVLRQPKDRRVRMLTLFACTPKGFRTHRIVVRAEAVTSVGGKSANTQKEGAMGGGA